MKRLIIAAAIVAAVIASSANADTSPAPFRMCVAWQNTCLKSVTILGIRYCTVHQFTCIKWR